MSEGWAGHSDTLWCVCDIARTFPAKSQHKTSADESEEADVCAADLS